MKKFFKQIFIAALVTIIAVSCSKSPTNPSGGINTPASPSEFVEKLKSIGMVKAGDQEWNFATISQSGNVLTVKPMNNNKSGYLLLFY